jgi:hypothetical protein
MDPGAALRMFFFFLKWRLEYYPSWLTLPCESAVDTAKGSHTQLKEMEVWSS